MSKRHRTGFEDDHTPLKKVKRVKGVGEAPNHAPTAKAVGGHITCDGLLQRHAVISWNVDPRVKRISAGPVALNYQYTDRLGNLHQKEHIPDFGVLLESGRVYYYDVEPFHRQPSWIGTRTTKLKMRYRERFRAGFDVLDERTLHQSPRWDNICSVSRHRGTPDREASAAVIKVLRRLGRPSTIGELRMLCDLRPPIHEHFIHGQCVSRTVMHQVDRSFSALMQHVATGFVEIDWGSPFTDDATQIRLSKEIDDEQT